MAIIKANDVVSGKEGIAFVVKEGNVRELAELRNIEATVELTKEDIMLIGNRGTGKKIAGWTGSGSMTIYYMTSYFRNMVKDYIKKGSVPYFDVQIKNEDPASSSGKQTIVLKNCLPDSVIMAKLDGDAGYLEEEVPFTFEDLEILDQFNEVSK